MNTEQSFDTLDLDKAIAYKIHRLARLLRVHINQLLQQEGLALGMEQWLILVRLYETPWVAQHELADQALNDHPNITRLIDQLAKRDWVQRAADAEDRRRHLVALTPAGRALVESFQPQVMAERKRLFGDFATEEVDQLLTMLAKIEQKLTPAAI